MLMVSGSRYYLTSTEPLVSPAWLPRFVPDGNGMGRRTAGVRCRSSRRGVVPTAGGGSKSGVELQVPTTD